MRSALFACLAFAALSSDSALAQTTPAKDQSILTKDPSYKPDDNSSALPAQSAAPEFPQPGPNDILATAPQTPAADTQGQGDDFTVLLSDIPIVETVELTPQTALKALDVYDVVLKKYQGGDMSEFDSVQAFVDKGRDGKAFEADVKAAGFASAGAWDAALNAVSFAFLGMSEDPGMEILAQIKEISADPKMSPEVKQRWISSLRASVPSQNNLTIVREMVKDPLLLERLQVLTDEEQGAD